MQHNSGVQLIRGRWLFTGTETIRDGAIAIQADTIQAVGQWTELRSQYPDAEILGSEQYGVMPGLINAHHHSNGVPNSLQGIEDDFLELWLFANLAGRSQDTTLKTLFSIAQLLRSGVTTVVDVASISGSMATCTDNLHQRLHAYQQAGMRVALTPGANYDSFLVHGEDEAFIASLPPALQQQVRELVPLTQALPPADYLDLITHLAQTYHDHPHIDVWFGPSGPQWVSDQLMVQIAAAAEKVDTHIQTHAVESFYEKLLGPRFYGTSVVAHLQDLGVLSPRFSIAHGVWLTEADIEILATTGAAVSHNPSSNLRLRAGVAPLNALLSAGVTVGLGMDGTTLGDDEDMFAEMRLATRLHRPPLLATPAPTYEDIFQMATIGGAKLMGQGDQMGQLAPGYRADVVLVKLDCLTWPWVAPEADPLHVMMMRAKAADVDTVLVNGQVVLQAGLPTGFDLATVGQELAAQLTAGGDRAPYRTLVTDLTPHLAQWYSQWNIPALTPYAMFNSKY
ncbi:MAG: amidohydrolase family protein [Leptolyngbyaceae bacterium]|nr:amidohydrolase family protein [Leptolyngbyaceae bacterium]